ncbi:MAG: hypothetical protein U0Q15_07900 [Kineosporiaceae bacterium]
MSHEELTDGPDPARAGAAAGPAPGASPLPPLPDDVTPLPPDGVDLDDAADLDDPTPDGDRRAPGRGRRWAVVTMAACLVLLAGSAGVHELSRARARAQLAATQLTVVDAGFDIRPLLYARLAGARPSLSVPTRMTLRNHGSRPVRVLALQVGDVPVVPVGEVVVPAGGTAVVRALARAACPARQPDPAPGMTQLAPGTAGARVRDQDGNVRVVTVRSWPSISARLPSGGGCDSIVWPDGPVRA